MLALVLVAALGQVDGGMPADAPTEPVAGWSVLPAGAVLGEEAVCVSVHGALETAKGIRACEAEKQAALAEISSGGGSTVRWAVISLTIGFAVGAISASVGVCALTGCLKR